jgi:hypothetical protein
MWQITTEYTKWPQAYVAAFAEVRDAIGQGSTLNSNMEFVDESSLMVSSASGLTTHNREMVTFTRSSDSATSSVDVALQGVAVNLPQDVLYIQAGTPAQKLTALVNIGSVTWTMSPSFGTLTSGGAFTPPATIGSVTDTTVTATSVANPAVATSMTVTIFPTGPIRIIPGSVPNVAVPYGTTPTPYTDTHGNVWTPAGGNGGYANAGSGWPTNPSDIPLYAYEFGGWELQDIRFDFIVPNGSYQITEKVASIFGTAGTELVKLEVQGQVLYDNLDYYVAAGGHDMPTDFLMPAVVTNNKLSFVVRAINFGAHLSALQIAPVQ